MAFPAALALVLICAVSGGLVLTAARRRPLSSRDGAPTAGDPPRVRLALFAAALIWPVAVMAWFARNSGFVWDDLKNLRQAQVQGLSLKYLWEPTSGHFAPGHRFGDWVAQTFFSYRFTLAHAVLLAGFVVSLILFHRILSELFRPGTGTVLVTLLYGASTVHVGVIQWWASGLDRVPATILSFTAILGYLRYHRRGSRWWLAVSVVSVPLGLLFYIKPVFVPLYLVLARLLLIDGEEPLRQSLEGVARQWRIWVLYGVTTGVALFLYVSRYPTELNETPTLAVFGRYLATLWFRVVAPSFFGVWVPQVNASRTLSALAIVACQLAFVALVGGTLWRARRSWRAWAFFAVGLAVNVAVVGFTRIGFFPPRIIAYTLYYNLETTYLFFLALGAAVLPRRRNIRGAPGPEPAEAAAVSAGDPERRPRPRRATVALGVAVIAYLGLSASGAHQINDRHIWVGARARTYTDHLSADLRRAAVGPSARPPAVVDGLVPEDVVPFFLTPYNGHSEVIPLFAPEVSFDPAGRNLYRVRRDGHLEPARLAPESGGPVGPLFAGGAVRLLEATSEQRGDAVCIRTGASNGSVVFSPPAPVRGGVPYASLRWSAPEQQAFALVPDPIGGVPPGGTAAVRALHLRPGPDEAGVFPLPVSTVARLVMVLGPHSDVCLHSLELGRLEPGH